MMTFGVLMAVVIVLLSMGLVHEAMQCQRWEIRAVAAERGVAVLEVQLQASNECNNILLRHSRDLVDRITQMQQMGFQVVPEIEEDEERRWSARDADMTRMKEREEPEPYEPLRDEDRIPPAEARKLVENRSGSS